MKAMLERAATLARLRPLFVVVALSSVSCSNSPQPPRRLDVWGSVAEALRDGKTEARVHLSDLDATGLVGVGAVQDLSGEITILDGQCTVSRVVDARVVTEQTRDVAATMLFAGRVEAWVEVAVEHDVAPADVAAFVEAAARDQGIDCELAFPFVVVGEVTDLAVHVLAGQCPIRARRLGIEMDKAPFRHHAARAKSTLVGIFAKRGGGVITHHGSALHVHAIVEGDTPFTGHCDSVGIAKGARLRLPRR